MSKISRKKLKEVLKGKKKFVNLSPVFKSLESIKNLSRENYQRLSQDSQDKLQMLLERVQNEFLSQQDFQNTITRLYELISEIEADFKGKQGILEESIQENLDLNRDLDRKFALFNQEVKNLTEAIRAEIKDANEESQALLEDVSVKVDYEIEKLAKESKEDVFSVKTVLSRISGGGNANRNIAVGGNTSVLSKYTDINIKPGSNVTLSYSNNETTKYLDLTISATGGSGTTRSINSISTSQTAGDTAGTDYVYVCSAGLNLTLPTAASNTNLYTIKNIAASSVLVSTTGGETIDGDTSLILNTQYTAVDLVNNGADNWSIT